MCRAARGCLARGCLEFDLYHKLMYHHRKRVTEPYAILEVNALQIAYDIDPEGQYHINGTVETVEKRCDKDSLWTIKFPYGGKDLTKLHREKPEVIVKVLKNLPDLMMGISVFHNNNMYHRDLKLNNIVYDAACHVRLIDFGIATSISDDDHVDKIYENIYALWPFETLMISGQKDIFNDNIYGDYISDNYYAKLNKIHHIDATEYKHNVITLRRAFRNRPHDLYSTVVKGIDVYSMGVSLSHLLTDQPVAEILGQSKQKQLLKLCRCMIEPYTKERISMSSAAHEMTRVLSA